MKGKHMQLAVFFKRHVRTDESSVHCGAELPADGVAVDPEGWIYIQSVTDVAWWDWHWEKTTSRLSVPKALKNAFRDEQAAHSGLLKAFDEEERLRGVFNKWLEDHGYTWFEYPPDAPAWVAYRSAHFKTAHLRLLAKSLSAKCDRIAHEKGLV